MNLRRGTSRLVVVVAVAGVAALLSSAQPALGREAAAHHEGDVRLGLPDTPRMASDHQVTPTDDSVQLLAVSAVSPTDVWAVGELYPSFLPVMRHFDGTGWTDVAVPRPRQESALFGVSADASDDAWAVGDTYDGSALHNLTLHWDGEKWRRVRSVAGDGVSPYLSAVSADSPTNAWAVGQNLAEHWDGTSWTRIAVPAKMQCYGVVSISPTDAWIVGGYGRHTATLHWDGGTLTQVSSPNGRLRYSSFGAVAASSSTDVWAVGASYKGDGKGILFEGDVEGDRDAIRAAFVDHGYPWESD